MRIRRIREKARRKRYLPGGIHNGSGIFPSEIMFLDKSILNADRMDGADTMRGRDAFIRRDATHVSTNNEITTRVSLFGRSIREFGNEPPHRRTYLVRSKRPPRHTTDT